MDARLVEQTVCSNLERVRRATSGVTPAYGKAQGLFELIACILGSRVRYETARAYAELVRDRVIKASGEIVGTSSLASRVQVSLSDPPHRIRTRFGRYPFPNVRAGWVADSLIQACRWEWDKWLHEAESGPLQARREVVRTLPGLGPKQASLFLRNVSARARVAVLDVHVIGYMKLVTPRLMKRQNWSTLGTYEELETVYLRYAEQVGADPRVLDVTIWLVMREAQALGIS